MSQCKVFIGSKYEGPSLDRPCLRQLPRHWVLSTEEPIRPRWWHKPDAWVGIVCALAYAVLFAQAVAQAIN